MTCANCSAPADWTYKAPGSPAIRFCEQHLPSFLKKDRSSLSPAQATPRRSRRKTDPDPKDAIHADPAPEETVEE